MTSHETTYCMYATSSKTVGATKKLPATPSGVFPYEMLIDRVFLRRARHEADHIYQTFGFSIAVFASCNTWLDISVSYDFLARVDERRRAA